MVSEFPLQSYYRSSSLPGDNKPEKFFDDEETSVLDETFFDQGAIDSGLELSPPMANSRRESFAVGPPLFSPKTEDWQSVDMQSLPSSSTFVDHHNNSNPFMRMEQTQGNAFGAQGSGWPLSHGSGSGTPLQQFDNVQAELDATTSIFQRSMQAPNPFATPSNMFASLGSDSHSIPASPQKEWMSINQPMSTKMRAGSPAIRSHNEMRRGDGIRKKNARFDIPAERNLSNIDQLIAQSTDEQEVKELKQQKRLLRNRQAALDSRQRKKQHTERLEDEKKQYTSVITDLEEELANMKSKLEQTLREKQSYADYAETITLEKDEMIRSHTLETGELRKKLGVLTEHIQRLEINNMSTTMEANHFPGACHEMEDLNMTGTWDNTNFLGDYNMEAETKPIAPVVPTKKSEAVLASDGGDKAASQGGLLFMLFLVGAFVMSSRSTPVIPPVSEDVRAASATLLNNVLKDAGVNSQPSSIQAIVPQPSGSSWSEQTPSMTIHGMNNNNNNNNGVQPSMLAELGDCLTQPTQEQTNEQIFSLSAAQYNGVSNQDFLQRPQDRMMSQGRRNLAEALTAMRNSNKQTGAADVYTRSLLWDQIPSEVVRNFAKMVAECNNAQNEQQCNEPIS